MPSLSLLDYCVRWNQSYIQYKWEVADINAAVTRRALVETPVHLVTEAKYDEMVRISKLTRLLFKGK